MKLPRERENKVQRSIRVRLARLGITLERRNVGARPWKDRTGRTRMVQFGRPGQSDLWGLDWPDILPWARHWEIETKADGEVPTPLQTAWLKWCHQRGAVAFWSDSANIAEHVAEAIIAGGRIVWRDGYNYDVEI
jgi:hypothetical protein